MLSQLLPWYISSWPPPTPTVNQSGSHRTHCPGSEPQTQLDLQSPPKDRNCPAWVIPVLRTSIQAPAGAGSPAQGDQLEAGLSSRQLPLISIKAFSPIASWMLHQVGSPTLLYPNQINSSKSAKYSQFGVTNSSN